MPYGELRPYYLPLNEEADIISCMYIKANGCYNGYREDLRKVVGFALSSCDEYRNDTNYESCLRQQLGDDLRGFNDNCVIDIIQKFWNGECAPAPEKKVKPVEQHKQIDVIVKENKPLPDEPDKKPPKEPSEDLDLVRLHTSDVMLGEYDLPLNNRKTGMLNVDRDKKKNPICTLTYEDTVLTDLGCDGVDKIEIKKKKINFSKIKDVAEKDRYNGIMESALDIVAPGIKLPRYSHAQKTNTGQRYISSSGIPKKVQNKIYFPTAEFSLDKKDKKTLDDFAAAYQGGDIVIEGYTDPRGDTSYNFELGKKRALATKGYLIKALKKLSKKCEYISTISFGEMGAAGKHMTSERRAVVTGGTTLVERALESSTSAIPQKNDHTYFLIDASGSMSPHWGTVSNYYRNYGQGLYSFSSCIGVRAGLYTPEWNCLTPLWNSMYFTVTNNIERGGHLVVLTDGLDNESTYNYNDVIKSAIKRNITISTIYIGNYHGGETELAEIAAKTGGFFYLKAE